MNFYAKDPALDDKSVLNVLLNLLALLTDWANEGIDPSQFKSDMIRKTSSKLDALMLIFLGRADSRIRKTCLLILIYGEKIFYAIIGRKESSIISIISRMHNRIIKDSITAFSINHLEPVSISESVLSGLEALDFFEIACSNYVHLFRFYYGSLAKLFSEFGDIRSICHINKYLHLMILPRLHKQPTSVSSLVNSLTASIMLLAFAGAPVCYSNINLHRKTWRLVTV